MISKEDFIKTIRLIQNFYSEQDTLGALIDRLTDGYAVVDFGSGLVNIIIDLLILNMGMQDQDLLSWWLYEDVDKIIYYNDEEINVSTPELLYDYIIKYDIK